MVSNGKRSGELARNSRQNASIMSKSIDKSGMNEEEVNMNDSNIINSSNSNIDEEFN